MCVTPQQKQNNLLRKQTNDMISFTSVFILYIAILFRLDSLVAYLIKSLLIARGQKRNE